MFMLYRSTRLWGKPQKETAASMWFRLYIKCAWMPINRLKLEDKRTISSLSSQPMRDPTEFSASVVSEFGLTLVKEGGSRVSPRKLWHTTKDSRLEFRLELGFAYTTWPEKIHRNWAPSSPASLPRNTLAMNVPPTSRIRAQIVNAASTKWDWTYSSRSWRPVTKRGNSLNRWCHHTIGCAVAHNKLSLFTIKLFYDAIGSFATSDIPLKLDYSGYRSHRLKIDCNDFNFLPLDFSSGFPKAFWQDLGPASRRSTKVCHACNWIALI